MKVIFLDIDGVVTSVRTGWYNLDIYAVNFLRWLCRESGAKIVISSTWRHNHDKDFWLSIFGEFMHDDFKTPVLRERHDEGGVKITLTRGTEIQRWLDVHEDIEQYLILDDDKDMLPHQTKSFIQTPGMDGLLSEHMMKAREYFKVESFPKEIELYQHKNMFRET